MSAWALNAADVGPFGVVLVVLVAVVGALAIHFLMLRRRRPAGGVPTLDEARIATVDGEITARLREVAAKMGLPERVLPSAHAPNGDGDFVWREGERYRYQSLERGGPVIDHADDSLDDVLFAVFRDRARMHAYLATIEIDEPAREAEIVTRQRVMLAAADPTWAARLGAGL